MISRLFDEIVAVTVAAFKRRHPEWKPEMPAVDPVVESLAKELCKMSGLGDPDQRVLPIELLSMPTPRGKVMSFPEWLDESVAPVPLWRCFEWQARYALYYSLQQAAVMASAFSTYDGSADQDDIASKLREVANEIWPQNKAASK